MAEENDERKSIWEAVQDNDVAALHDVLMSDGFNLLTLYDADDDGETALSLAAHTGASECLSLIFEFMIGVACDLCKSCLLRHADVSKIVQEACPLKPPENEANEMEQMEVPPENNDQDNLVAVWLEEWRDCKSCMMTCFMKKQRSKGVCFSQKLYGSCLKHYLDILEFTNYHVWTALLSAAYKGQTKTVEILVDAGARPDVVTPEWDSALDLARGQGHMDIVNLLKELRLLRVVDLLMELDMGAGATIIATDLALCAEATDKRNHRTLRSPRKMNLLLDKVAREGNTKIMVSLLEITKHVFRLARSTDVSRKYPCLLLKAAMSRKLTANMVGLLLDRGFHPHFWIRDGEMPLLYISGIDLRGCDPALEEDVVERIRKLVRAGANVNYSSYVDGDSVLIRNFMYPNLLRQTCFLELGADVRIKNFDNDSPLTMASCMPRRLEYTKALVEAGADVNHENNIGETALFEAVFRSDCEVIRYLVEHGARVDHRNMFNESLLMHVAGREHSDPALLDVFLEEGAVMTGEEFYPILRHKYNGNKIDMLQELLRRGLAPTPILICQYHRLNFAVHLPPSLEHSVFTPKIAARLTNSLNVVEFLEKVWFDTPCDIHGRLAEKLNGLQCLEGEDTGPRLLQEKLPKTPYSLSRLSFVTVTAILGGSGPERLKRIDALQISQDIKDKLKFKHPPRDFK